MLLRCACPRFVSPAEDFWVPGLSGAESLGGTRETLEGWCSCFGSICENFAPSISWKTFQWPCKNVEIVRMFLENICHESWPCQSLGGKFVVPKLCVDTLLAWQVNFYFMEPSKHFFVKLKNLRWYLQQHWRKIQPQQISATILHSKAQTKRPQKAYQSISLAKSPSPKTKHPFCTQKKNAPTLHSINACKRQTASTTPLKQTYSRIKEPVAKSKAPALHSKCGSTTLSANFVNNWYFIC